MILSQFGLDGESAAKVLQNALSRGGEFADLYCEQRISSSIFFEDDIVKSAGRGIAMGAGVRVLKGDQSGYAFSEDLSLESLIKAAKTAAAIADDKTARVQVESVHEIKPRDLYPLANETGEVDLDAKLKYIREANAAARSFSPFIIKVSCSLADELKYLSYLNSEGTSWSDVQPMMVMRVGCIAERDGKRQNGSDSGGGRIGLEYFETRRTASQIAIEAARLSVLGLDAADAPAGPMEVVLGPSDSGVLLHEAVGHGLEADFNRKDLSNYSGRVGQRVASELCTIVD